VVVDTHYGQPLGSTPAVATGSCLCYRPTTHFGKVYENGIEILDFITFCVSRRRREMYCGHRRLCVCVCVSVCLSAAVRPHYCADPDVTWRSGRGCPVVVHYGADLQPGHGLRCYGNITRTPNVSEYIHACTRSMPSFICDIATDYLSEHQLTFLDHITSLSKCYYSIRELRCVRHCLDSKAASLPHPPLTPSSTTVILYTTSFQTDIGRFRTCTRRC